MHLRVASENLMAEHPSLSLRSGELLCVNCLKAVQKNDCEVAFEPAGRSSLSQEVAFEPAGPSSLSQECAESTPYSSTQDSDSSSVDMPGSPTLHKI